MKARRLLSSATIPLLAALLAAAVRVSAEIPTPSSAPHEIEIGEPVDSSDDRGGILLPGHPAFPALGAVTDLPTPGVLETEILFDDTGAPFLSTTHFLVVLDPVATVGEVNAALEKAGARILGMTQGKDVLEIRIPDPGGKRGLTDVRILAGRLRRLPPFKDALPVSFE